MSDRGKKKWLPFKSLKEQDGYLEKVYTKHHNKEKLKQTPEQSEQISSFLLDYHGQITTINYIKDYEECSVTGIITKIDVENQRLKISDSIIPFTSILFFVEQ